MILRLLKIIKNEIDSKPICPYCEAKIEDRMSLMHNDDCPSLLLGRAIKKIQDYNNEIALEKWAHSRITKKD